MAQYLAKVCIMNISSRKIFILSMVMFRILLESSYAAILSEKFFYLGYAISLDVLNYIFSWILFLLSMLMVDNSLKKVSDYFFISIFLSLLVPILIVYGYDDDRSLAPAGGVMLSMFIIKWLVSSKTLKVRSLRTISGGVSASSKLAWVFVLFLLVWYFYSGVAFNFNFLQVYDYRADNAERSAFSLLAYTNSWTYQIFSMFLLSLALYRRNFLMALTIILIQVYFFAASAHKTILFLPLVVMFIWFYFRRNNDLIVFPVIYSLAVAISIISHYFYDDIYLSSFISRRVLFTPALLSYAYFDFFENNSFVMWSNSIFSGFFNYTYFDTVGKTIGGYLGREDMGANNGYVSMGYAHLGWIGIILYSLLLGVILKFIDFLCDEKIPLWFAVAIFSIPIRSVVQSSDLLTVLLTHGMLISIFMIWMFRDSRHSISRNN